MKHALYIHLILLIALTLIAGCATNGNKPTFKRGKINNTQFTNIIIDSVKAGNKVSITRVDGEVIELWVREVTSEHISNTKAIDKSKTRKELKIEISDIESIKIIKESAMQSEDIIYHMVFNAHTIGFLFLFLVFGLV
ncbi:hypothetical protein RI844_18320 [Thalassotalea fonticola]|uniref:Lipoprotein n=1 Tax=Thalassotalea fonticola TaxID=3065649 RepID=A0ABZ0GNG7_9GAMM|nr:hypothetical protein RI844_18320 [Colwelliaceae bacterium S1-1]